MRMFPSFDLKCFSLIFLVLGTARPAFCGDARLTAQVDRTDISMNDTATLRLTLFGGRLQGGRPELPEIPGLRATFAGQSQNFSFVNGDVSSQITYTYALAPQSPGVHVIPALTLEIDGQQLSTDPITLRVVSGSVSPPTPAAPPTAAPASPNIPKGRDLFVTTTVDKKKAFVGEAVTMTFRFYTRVRLLNQPNYQPPDTTGFLAEDLPPQKQYVTTVNGTQYQVIELATALFPSAPGTATIGSASLECRVQDFSRDPFGGDTPSLFDDFFTQSRRLVLRSDPLTIAIRALPAEGRPASFQGDVGRYKISATVDKTAVALHEPLSLTVTVEGDGNVKALSKPALPSLQGFKTYETLSSLNIEKKDGRVRGSKVHTTVLKPDVTGDLVIPPIEFSFFDPETGRYQTGRTRSLTVRVQPGETEAVGSGVSYGAPAAPLGEGIKEITQDIRYIRPHLSLTPAHPPLHERSWFRSLQWIPACLFLIFWVVTAARRRWDLANLWESPARRARRAVARARSLRAQDPSAHHEALHRAFLTYLGKRFKTNSTGLTWTETEALLTRAGYSNSQRRQVGQLWDEFDRIRYAPGAITADDGDRAARELLAVVTLLEKETPRS